MAIPVPGPVSSQNRARRARFWLLTGRALVLPQSPTVKLVMFACSKYCVFFIFSFMRVLINAMPPDVRYLKQKGQIYACFNYCVLMHSH